MTVWGIVGAGWAASDFADGLRHLPAARIGAVCSPRRAAAFAERIGVARHYGDVGQLVADTEIDVVYVATPNSLHHEHCLAALQAGKPVVCEKPFALTAAEAGEVVGEARRLGLFCMEAMPMRFVPATLRARELVDSGVVGDIRLVSASFGHRPVSDADSRFDVRLGGGALLDAGVYAVSLALLLLGAPQRISATAVIGTSGVDDQSVAVLGFEEGRLAVVEASLRTQLRNEAVISGTAGEIRLAPLFRPDRVTVQRFDEAASAGWRARARRGAARLRGGPATGAVPYEGNGLTCEAAEAMRCLDAGLLESPLMPLNATLQVMDTLDRIRACWATA